MIRVCCGRSLCSLFQCNLILSISIVFCFSQCSSNIASTRSDDNFLRGEQKLLLHHKKPGHAKPLIAVVGANSGSETTDYIIPLSVLRRSGVAQVIALSTEAGPILLMPALKMYADQTVDEFDKSHPEGADIVIVPALHDSQDAVLISWIKKQFSQGATVVSICEGARVVANAGLFTGGSATTHWYAFDDLKKRSTDVEWRQDARYIQNGRVISTAGVTASIPTSIALVEAIAGKKTAENLAKDLHIESYANRHDGSKFRLDWGYRWLAVKNILSFWSNEKIGISMRPGVDELGLALIADAYSRTYRSKAVTLNDLPVVESLSGLRFIPDANEDTKVDVLVPVETLLLGEKALVKALTAIRERYGHRNAAFVALQLEYPYE